ncbi:hypothetical protein BX600DRAFT_467024 [Xylariales sp. PMI_506]|nr:hypothetical protein BX600DRAFT_467024 [Xylariales sp. PMI_506]
MPSFMLTIAGRVLFLLLLCGLLILIVAYDRISVRSSFTDFMNSESVGVRVLFTSVGVITSLFWHSYFQCVALVSPYKVVRTAKPRLREKAFNISPPTNAFSGLYKALLHRYGDFYLGFVAATSIMSIFLPALLNNVPYRVIETYLAHMVCTWLAVAILSIMVIVMLASFFVQWPNMPMDPSTLAGAMYYVVNPDMLLEMEQPESRRGFAHKADNF